MRKRATKPKPTIEELAIQVGISKRQLERDIQEGCPRTSVTAIKRWRASNRRQRSVTDIDDALLKVELLREQLRHEREKRRKLALDRKQKLKELVSREQIEKEVQAAVLMLRNRLMSLPTQIAMHAPGEIKGVTIKMTQNTIRVALKELKDQLEGMI